MRGKPVTIQKVTAPRLREQGYKFAVLFRQGGKRSYQYCRTKDEAETKAQRLKVDVQNSGLEATGAFEAFDKVQLVRWRQALAEHGATFEDAVGHYLKFLAAKAKQSNVTVKALFNSVLDAKEREGLSTRYQTDLRVRLARFAEDHGNKLISEIDKSLLDSWLSGLRLAPVTVANFRRVLAVAFSHATSHGWISSNPVATAMKPKIIEGEVGILTPGELGKLLSVAHSDILPALAIGAFAGLRRAELERLEWSDLDMEGGHIEVSAKKAKSARRRLVKIQPCLGAWLQPFAGRKGRIWPDGERGRNLFDAAKTTAGFDEGHSWPSNALRHSFASYYLAQFNDAAALALELGHTDQRLIFAHYRELVKPKQAAQWWNVMPTGVPENVIRLQESTKAA